MAFYLNSGKINIMPTIVVRSDRNLGFCFQVEIQHWWAVMIVDYLLLESPVWQHKSSYLIDKWCNCDFQKPPIFCGNRFVVMYFHRH